MLNNIPAINCIDCIDASSVMESFLSIFLSLYIATHTRQFVCKIFKNVGHPNKVLFVSTILNMVALPEQVISVQFNLSLLVA